MLHILPVTPELRLSRNSLLQRALRSESPQTYSIEAEYPLVLPLEKSEYSFCGILPNSPRQVLVHANFLPRTLDTQIGPIQVGFIGNVATDETVRGQGWMRHLFSFLENHARNHGLAALILWSDLPSFYHKLGYTPFGSERRFQCRLEAPAQWNGEIIVEETPDSALFAQLDTLRPVVPLTYQRTQAEWGQLLLIPDSILLLAISAGEVEGFCILGKGYDMIGVVHEWGAREPAILERLLQHILAKTGWQNLTLLAPPKLDTKWEQWLDGQECSLHPVGLLQALTPQAKILETAFFWGMDGI